MAANNQQDQILLLVGLKAAERHSREVEAGAARSSRCHGHERLRLWLLGRASCIRGGIRNDNEHDEW